MIIRLLTCTLLSAIVASGDAMAQDGGPTIRGNVTFVSDYVWRKTREFIVYLSSLDDASPAPQGGPNIWISIGSEGESSFATGHGDVVIKPDNVPAEVTFFDGSERVTVPAEFSEGSEGGPFRIISPLPFEVGELESVTVDVAGDEYSFSGDDIRHDVDRWHRLLEESKALYNPGHE